MFKLKLTGLVSVPKLQPSVGSLEQLPTTQIIIAACSLRQLRDLSHEYRLGKVTHVMIAQDCFGWRRSSMGSSIVLT